MEKLIQFCKVPEALLDITPKPDRLKLHFLPLHVIPVIMPKKKDKFYI